MPYPLGVPKNRPVADEGKATPIPGRPNWFRDKHGREFYVEPNKKPPQPGGDGKP